MYMYVGAKLGSTVVDKQQHTLILELAGDFLRAHMTCTHSHSFDVRTSIHKYERLLSHARAEYLHFYLYLSR